jgi:predicted dinucleotide-binding enzyme
MSISIIGTGKVGIALAHVFARNHLEACAAKHPRTRVVS